MLKTMLLLCALSLCAGCSDQAARQHQADQDRRQQTADDLRTLGERMHNQQTDDAQQADATDQ